eukprot:GFUD01107183.1.p1 GENE.GFUD01107183.1~~GFUD01107183.1.p1  ORF type:complete len:404 (+),score=99.60 GFUD01107183.1:75-1286(+)
MSSLAGKEDWEETSAMCGEKTLKTEKITTNQGKKKKMLFFPLLALAATQNYSTPMFGESIENKQTFQEMYSNDNPFLDILLDFIKSLTISTDDTPPVDLDELYSMLPTDSTDNSNKASSTLFSLSPTDDFRFPGSHSTQFGYSGLIDKSEIVLDANQENKKNLDPVTSPEPAFSFTPSLLTSKFQLNAPKDTFREMSGSFTTESSPLFPDTLPTFSPATSLPKYDLQIIPGTNQYQSGQTKLQKNSPPLVSSSNLQTVTASAQLLSTALPPVPSSLLLSSPLPSPALSSSSSLDLKASSSSPFSISMSNTTTVLDNYAEMRRKNNLACKLYRGMKKTKQELADEELEQLKEKNEVLNMKVRQMESIIKDIREKVITGITQPRGNIREFEDDNQTVCKRRRCEP